MPSKHGWTCPRCTFEHQFPGTRCVMCNSLRTTKDQMAAFVKGKPIPESTKRNASTISSDKPPKIGPSSKSTTKKQPTKKTADTDIPRAQMNQTSASAFFTTGSNNTTGNATASVAAKRANPYAKKKGGATETTSKPVSLVGTGNSTNAQSNENLNPNNHDRSNPNSSEQNRGNTVQPQHQHVAISNENQPMAANNDENTNQQQKPPPNRPSTKPATSRPKNGRKQTFLPMPKRPTNNAVYGKPAKPRVPSLPYAPGPVPFDESTISTWIYPLHPKYARRDYQLEMSKTAVFENTLVSLPTGLGKTMIAAVVLYNYYRWFPEGKLVFCAPTLPLVRQQVKAVYDIVGIPMSDTAVLTGKVKADDRVKLWDNNRLFFCTPQTIENDMRNKAIDASKVVCLVLDEVHKSRGDHSYVQVMKQLRDEAKAKFRLVGLSATPGSSIDIIQDVITTLGVSRIECRSDDDPSIRQYTHAREHEVIEVEDSNLVTAIKDAVLELMRAPLKRIQQNGFLSTAGSGATISAWSVLVEKDKFYDGLNKGERRCDPRLRPDFLATHKLVMWRECIQGYGIGQLRSTIRATKNASGSGGIKHVFESEGFSKLWALVHGAVENTQGDARAEELLVQNPKLKMLKEILNEHFERARAKATDGTTKAGEVEVSTRAIVFSQLRCSVLEIVDALKPLQPLVRPRRFVGQGKGGKTKEQKEGGGDVTEEQQKGMNQAEQHKALQEFRSGIYNVLVCTSIGEEGLDIGEVDLIVNFDCLSSPIRMLQRVGRTGRARDGRVVSILSKGEEAKHKRSKTREKTLIRALKDPTKMKFSPNVPMFPDTPSLLEKEVRSSDVPEFSFTQVGGICGPRKRKRRSSNEEVGSGQKKRKARVETETGWKLTPGEEALRQDLVGRTVSKCCADDDSTSHTFPLSLRRRFLKARTMSYAAQTPRDVSRYALGSTLAILRIMQESHGSRYDPSRVPVSRSFFRDESATRLVFPVEEVAAESCSLTKVLEYSKAKFRGADTVHTHASTVDLERAASNPPLPQGLPRQEENGFNDETRECQKATSMGSGVDASAAEHQQLPVATTENVCQPSSVRQKSQPKEQTVVEPGKSDTAFPAGHTHGKRVANPYKMGNPYKKKATPKPQAAVARSQCTKITESEQQHDNQPTGHGAQIRPSGRIVAQQLNTNKNAQDAMLVETGRTTDNAIQVRRDSENGHSIEPKPQYNDDGPVQSLGTAAKASTSLAGKSEAPSDTGKQENCIASDPFYLPTPPDSSSSEEEGDDSDDDSPNNTTVASSKLPICTVNEAQGEANRQDSNVAMVGSEKRPSENNRDCEHQQNADPMEASMLPATVVIENLPAELKDEVTKAGPTSVASNPDDDSQSLRLPTQSSSSSSSSEESDDDHDQAESNVAQVQASHIKKPSSPISNETSGSPAESSNAADGNRSVSEQQADCNQVDLPFEQSQQRALDQGCHSQSYDDADSEVPDFKRRKKPKSKKVDMFLTQIELPSDTPHKTPTLQQFANIAHQKTSEGLVDTPLQLVDTPHTATNGVPNIGQSGGLVDTPHQMLVDTPQTTIKGGSGSGAEKMGHQELADTPMENSPDQTCIDDAVCAVCLSDTFPKDDPIIFCDGAGCNLAFHLSCYSIDAKVLEEPEETPWYCDPCSFHHGVRPANAVPWNNEQFMKCLVCHQRQGPLKKVTTKLWHHACCAQWTDIGGPGGKECAICHLKGAVPCGKAGCSVAVHPHCAVTSILDSSASWTLLQARFSSTEAQPANERQEEKALSLLFCPDDTDEARQISENLKDAPKMIVIPPDRFAVADSSTLSRGRKRDDRDSRRRLTKGLPPVAPPRPALNQEVVNIDEEAAGKTNTDERNRERKRARLESRKLARCFFDEEAGIGSEEDSEGDEGEARELALLEAEENSQSSFINDSSQLGFTQDHLDHVDPDRSTAEASSLSCGSDAMHRRLDNQRTQQNLFATPFFNRKMQRDSLTPSNAPESERGLGKMHFVRSVLEHHRNGGGSDEIEGFYNHLEEEQQQEGGDDEED